MYAYPLYRLNRSVGAVIAAVAGVIGALMAPIPLTWTTEATAPAVLAVVATSAQQVDPAAWAIAVQQHVTLAQAGTRLSWQRAVPSLNTALSSQLPAATFGGIWIAPNDGDRVKVGVVGLTPGVRAIVMQAVRAVGLSGATDLVPVEYSLGQLVSADTWLAAQLDELSFREAGAVHLDAGYRTDLNRVQLGVAGRNLTAGEQALVTRALGRYGNLVQVVAQPAGSAIAAPLDCTDNLSVGQFCNAPLRGGIEIFTVNSQGKSQKGLCTGGFIARGRSSGALYQLTAGHCAVEVPNGATNRWATGFANLSGHVIGTMHHYIWGPSGDVAILSINNPTGWHLPQGWVAVMAGPNTTLNEEYPISSAQYSTQGARICESGEASGSICGTVKELGVSWCYGPFGQPCIRVNNLGEASFCGKQGDSGAPVFAAHQAFGLVVALQTNIYGNCVGGTFYQGIIGASNAMNVNIVLAHLPAASSSRSRTRSALSCRTFPQRAGLAARHHPPAQAPPHDPSLVKEIDMQDPAYSSPPTLPLSFRGRSPVDGIRLRWAGIGDVALSIVCFVNIRNVGGVILGLLLVALAIATWAVTRLGAIHWYDLAPAGKAVAGTGAAVGLSFLYLFFLAFWMVVGAFKLFTSFSK